MGYINDLCVSVCVDATFKLMPVSGLIPTQYLLLFMIFLSCSGFLLCGYLTPIIFFSLNYKRQVCFDPKLFDDVKRIVLIDVFKNLSPERLYHILT